MRKFVATIVALVVAASVVFAGSNPKQHKKKVASQVELERQMAIPDAPIIQVTSRLAVSPATGDPIGRTDYDYGWNAGTRQMVEAYFPGATPGTKAQFSYMQRDGLLTGNDARRAQSYVYYNGTTYTAVAATIPKATRATGFGDISVYRSASADGFAAVTSHVPPAIAINADTGSSAFTFTNIPVVASSESDPISAIRGRSDTVYVATSGRARDDIFVYRSVDFGVSWQFLDSLKKYTPKKLDPSLDPSMQVLPNGHIYIFCALTGAGAIPPVGTVGDLDSADQIGYFRSTNNGTSWTWTRVAVDGQALETSAPGDRFIPENFGQLDGVVDQTGVVHIVFNGYNVSYGVSDTVGGNKLMYWNSSVNTFRNISRAAETRNEASTSLYSGNALGRCYPTISYDPTSRMVFAAWSEPQVNGAAIDTANGVLLYDVWWAWSDNGGTTWTAAANATNTRDSTELFVTADRWLTQAGAATNQRRAHMVYFQEARANTGCFVFSEGPRSQSPWIYRIANRNLTAVGDVEQIPGRFVLAQNYPNPFNPSTKISYSIPSATNVRLSIYNALGQEVATLVNEVKNAGSYEADFSAANLSSGVYFYTLKAGAFTETKKMILMK